MKQRRLPSVVPWALLGLGLVAGCSATPEAPAPDPLALATAANESEAPHTLEVTLTAKESSWDFGAAKPSPVWTYNGTVPGPLLDARVGDRLVVHFQNRLPEATTVHWHGLRLPNAMDGAPDVSGPVEPGGTFTYDFTLKDAGLFWFHPHVRTDVQVERGLAGVLRVRGVDEPVVGTDVDEERVLVFDDVRVNDDGTFPTYLDDNSKMMGREGNTLLVNGRRTPTLSLRPGALVRWRMLNVANGRFFQFHIPGVSFHVVGSDGGSFAEPYDTDRLLIAPAERYDVYFRVPNTPETLPLTTEPYDRGHDSGTRPAALVAQLNVAGAAVTTQHPFPKGAPVAAPIPVTEGTPRLPFVLSEGTDAAGELVFSVNGATYPNVPTASARVGQPFVARVENQSEMDHPFHLHGTFFQQLDRDGVAIPPGRRVAKDTIVIPAKSTLNLAAAFDEPGMWMYHCHINEHSEGGMMGMIHAAR